MQIICSKCGTLPFPLEVDDSRERWNTLSAWQRLIARDASVETRFGRDTPKHTQLLPHPESKRSGVKKNSGHTSRETFISFMLPLPSLSFHLYFIKVRLFADKNWPACWLGEVSCAVNHRPVADGSPPLLSERTTHSHQYRWPDLSWWEGGVILYHMWFGSIS